MTARALAEGDQTITLRKGGIREDGKHFAVEHERFLLYPTFDHQRSDLIRAPYRQKLRESLADGIWESDLDAHAALEQDGQIGQPRSVRVSTWAEVVAAIEIVDPTALDALSAFHIWTADYAQKRLKWKRKHPLCLLLLRAHRLQTPLTVPLRAEYRGCISWLELELESEFEDNPVLGDPEFERATQSLQQLIAG